MKDQSKLVNYFENTVRGTVFMLAGVGFLHFGQLFHWWNFTVDSMEIHPAQAEVIQKKLDYYSPDETIQPPKKVRRN